MRTLAVAAALFGFSPLVLHASSPPDDGVLAASTDTAVGMRLPLEDLSVWRLHGRTAWGLELSASASRLDNDVPIESSTGVLIGKLERRFYSAAVAVTRISLRETDHDVKPFSFLRWGISAGLNDDGGNIGRRSMSLSATAGIGVGWKPFDRVGVWVRKGLTVAYRRNSKPVHSLDRRAVSQTLSLVLRQAPQAIVYATF